MKILEELSDVVLRGDRNRAKELTTTALAEGAEPGKILDTMVGAMSIVGQRFRDGQIFVPEMLIAAAAMKNAMEILEPQLVAAGIKPERTAIIGTVTGDLHDIGKNLVTTMWRGARIEVIDLGIDVPPAKFVEAAQSHKPDLIGMSALLTTTMDGMKKTIDALREAGVTDAKIVVGGAPVTDDFAKKIGADGYGANASAAVDVARELLGMGSVAG